ncbi:conserved hypothetical protein [Culex quinquefasciatus]|uniref:Uncharacterized protein n=1 Tax=Culex quinquefasciatus TaxID=7176 RepID=B0XC31_CULQU|nr:conserved hypothetical protein [Culex quinquefasciatus]|eukprot:XP_001867203.1 conserved hypothetical protein [Culex quinquefasciatus]
MEVESLIWYKNYPIRTKFHPNRRGSGQLLSYLPFSPAAQASNPKESSSVGQPCGNFRLASLNQAAGLRGQIHHGIQHRRCRQRSSCPDRQPAASGPPTRRARCDLERNRLFKRRRNNLRRQLQPIDSKPECQSIMSVRSSDRFRQQVVEALRRAKFKFPSRRKIFIWKKWDFTKYDRDQHQVYWDGVCLVSDGCGVKFFNDHGPLKKREAYERARLA